MAEPELAKRKQTLITSAIAVKVSENHNPEALVLQCMLDILAHVFLDLHIHASVCFFVQSPLGIPSLFRRCR